MEINQYEAGMMDAVLEAFVGRMHLDWTELMELFDGDEELAAAIIDILEGMDLVTKSGEETRSGLPEKILRTDEAASFIEKGGFTAHVKGAQQPTAGQPEVPEPLEGQRLPSKAIIFEIENKLTEELPVKEEVPMVSKPPAILPAETAPPAAEVTKQAPDALLEQEIAHLRLEQRRFEHRLREKDIIIQNLTVQNETLGYFRIFIWVLLGLIALLVAGMIFHR